MAIIEATEGFGFDDHIVAGADLSSHQYKVINIAGTIAATADAAYGILKNKPQSGEDAQLKVLGRAIGLAGAAVAANASLKVQSGYLIAIASGDNTIPCGKNLSGAVSSGDELTVAVNFLNGGSSIQTASL